MKNWKFWRWVGIMGLSLLAFGVPGCSLMGAGETEVVSPGGGIGMGPGNSMMQRHHAEVPEDYTGLTNPVTTDNESLARGIEIYTERCVTCHGDYGNGDGPAGAGLDPAPAAISHTSQMLSDAYLFWRITEGGAEFGTGMLPFGEILTENERWDVINYVRALGRGDVQPGEMMGGEPFDQAAELAQRAEMLAAAIEQGVISEGEGQVFDQVHSALDAYLDAEGDTSAIQALGLAGILDAMVANGLVTSEQAKMFQDVHDRLVSAGLME